MTSPKTKRGRKVVKAWGFLDYKGRLIPITFSTKKSARFWSEEGELVVRVLVSYEVPKKPLTKKR